MSFVFLYLNMHGFNKTKNILMLPYKNQWSVIDKKMSGVKIRILKVKRITSGLVVLVVVMAFIAGTAVPFVSATTFSGTQEIESQGQYFDLNYDNITITLNGSTSKVLIGQVIQFYNSTGGPSGTVTLSGESGEAEDHEQHSDDSGKLDTDLKPLKEGTYTATCALGCVNTTITVEEPYMKLKLKRNGKSIDSIPGNTIFTVELSTNLDPNDGITLEVTDPSGNLIKKNYDETVFDKVNVSHITDLEINTSGWELGTYTFKVLTEEEYARGLEEESNEVELEIVSGELKIEAQKTEIVESENVKLTVTGVPDLEISIFVERNAEHAIFPASKNDNLPEDKIGTFNDTINAGGEMEYLVYFDRIGSYTVKVKDLNGDSEDYVDIAVSKKKVTFMMPEICAIGAALVINGTANTGKTVDIAIDDVIVKVGTAIDNEGKFEVKLPTPDTPGTGTEDVITIKAFIDPEVDFYLGDDASGVADDGSAMVLMVTGSLTAESSTPIISPGDLFTLSGTAQGSKVVDILIVAPKGGSGNGMNPTNSEENGLPSGIIYEMASVSSGTYSWSSDIDVHEDADTGLYLAFVLTPGKNQEYDEIGTDDLLDGIADKYLGGDLSKLAAKTQEQINAILLDATTEAAGSDDFMKTVKITVGKAEVALYSPADVVIGDNLTIAGISNREGHTIIVKVKGPIDLGTKFVTVEDGKFKATFSTSEALTGEYTVEADDGEGHTDTKTVSIITPIRAEPTPTSTSTLESTPSQPIPESAPATQPENASNENASKLPVPGFEAAIVIPALLTVYLLVFVAKKRRA